MKKTIAIIIIALGLCAPLSAENNQDNFSNSSSSDIQTGPETLSQDSTTILMDELVVSAGISNVNTSPLRLKQIEAEKIQTIATGRTFPELMGRTPSVYATRETGSYGDANINIRGFKQENIAILLNGIPISGLTSGNMYWNNWMGLSDATASIQLQKGIGSSMLADNSVGGTINILTASPQTNFGAGAGYSLTGYGLSKVNLHINSGDLGRGWAFSLAGSYTWGTGYVDCTDVSAWSYIASVTKVINKQHSLAFTALGSPETHEQRSTRMTYDELSKYGSSYNKNWGWYEGEQKTIARNKYFKPYFTLSHFYSGRAGRDGQFAIKVNSGLYLAIGMGGGVFTESTGRRIISFLDDRGQIDWNAVEDYNRTSEGGAAQNILSDFTAGHTQAGAKSSVIVEFNDRVSLDAGIHYQLYNTYEYEQITDLLGGNYWMDGDRKVGVGDFIRTDNGRNMNYFTAYGMGTFNLGARKNWIVKAGASVSGVTITRWDKYNYAPDNIWSDVATGLGGSFKTGVLYKVNGSHSLYLNGGVYSRAPYYGVYFASGNNAISENIHNENNYLAELGYRFVGNTVGTEITLYAASWQNKTIKSNPYKPLDEDSYRFMVTGLDAFHYGGEWEIYWKLRNILRIDAFASIGDWRWVNDVHATIYDPYTDEPMQTIDVYSNGLHVGDAPQTQVGASFDFHPIQIFRPSAKTDITLAMDWTYNDRFWADFDPITRTDPNDRSDAYRIPAYHILNLHASITHEFSSSATVSFFFNLNNLLDALYIERGKDGTGHDAATFTGYWSAPRNYNFGVRVNF